MAWIELHQALRSHPKLIHLATLLKVDPDTARVKLENLWLWALDYCPHGALTVASRGMTPEEVAIACSWEGDATLWVRSLIDAGWIDSRQGGEKGRTLYLHDWQDYGGKWCKKREADIARKHKMVFQSESERIPDGFPTASTVTGQDKQDRTGQDKQDRTAAPPGGSDFGKLSDEFTSLTGRPSLGGGAPDELMDRIKGLLKVRGLGPCLKVMTLKISECVQKTGRPPSDLRYFVPIFEDDRLFGGGSSGGSGTNAGAKEILRHFALPDGELDRKMQIRIAEREKRERSADGRKDGASEGGGEAKGGAGGRSAPSKLEG